MSKPLSWAAPSGLPRAPKRARLRLRASLLSLYKRPPLANALLHYILPAGDPTGGSDFLKYEAYPTPRGGAPLMSAPVYLRVNKATSPTRAVLRLFYLYVSNPTPSAIPSNRALALWGLAHSGGLVKTPFSAL